MGDKKMWKNAKKGICILLVLLMAIGFNTSSSNAAMTTPEYCIIINTKTNKLAYYKSGKLVKEFKVGTGKSSTPTPLGKSKIVNKIKNRPYYKYGIPGGDPRNPLGDRWLGLQLRGTYGTTYGIHGNNNSSSIGKNVSAGCIRMYNDDVRWLYDQVPIGTTVILESSTKSYVDIAKSYNVNLESSADDFKTLTNDIYKYDAGSGNYLTYINGYGYSQYSYVNKSGNYAFTPSSWMVAAGLEVTMPSSSNGYKMNITNPYKTLASNLNDVLSKARNGELSLEQIKAELDNVKKVNYKDSPSVYQVYYNTTLVKDIYKYNAGSGNYLTNINGSGYSQYSYLNTSGKYAFTPSSWMKAAGLDVTMPSSSNGYIMEVNNPYAKEYNRIIEELKTYL